MDNMLPLNQDNSQEPPHRPLFRIAWEVKEMEIRSREMILRASGQGTRAMTLEEANRLVLELNEDYQHINHYVIPA